MSALREIAASFGIEFDAKALEHGVHSISGAVGAVKQLAEVITGAAIVHQINDFVGGLTEVGSGLNDAADRLGITTDALQALHYAFGQAGVRGQQVDNALAGLSVRLEQAKGGAGPAAAAVHRLGLRLRDATGQIRPVGELMPEIAAGMDRITNPAERVSTAMALFGGVGRRLVGVLHGGSGGLAEMAAQMQELGGGMSGEAVKAADDYGDSLDSMKLAALSLRSAIGLFLLPVFKAVTDWAGHAIADFLKLTRGTHVLQLGVGAMGAALVAAAVPVITAWAPVIAPFVAMVLAASMVVAIVDDVWTAIEGGDSAIGRLVDAQLGMNAMRDAIAGAQLVWLDLNHEIDTTLDLLVQLSAIAQRAVPHITEEGRREAAAIEAENTRRDATRVARDAEYQRERAALVGGTGPSVEQARERARLMGTAGGASNSVEYQGAGGRARAVDRTNGNNKGGMKDLSRHQTTHVAAGAIVVHAGTQSTRAIGAEVLRQLQARERAANDAEHPVPAREG